jgi:hypothetical protein
MQYISNRNRQSQRRSFVVALRGVALQRQQGLGFRETAGNRTALWFRRMNRMVLSRNNSRATVTLLGKSYSNHNQTPVSFITSKG